MTADELRKWANQQTTVLIELGIDAMEAERSVKWVLAHLPPDADPRTYIFPAETLYEDPSTDAAVADARADWYQSDAVGAKFKRLLDATTETGA